MNNFLKYVQNNAQKLQSNCLGMDRVHGISQKMSFKNK